MSQFALSPATLSDLPEIATVSRAAFKDSLHTMTYWIFPQDNEEAIYKWRLNGITKIFKNESNCTYMKVVDTAVGRIVAFALWEAPHSPETDKGGALEEQEKKQKSDTHDSLPEGTKDQLMHEFEAETQKMRDKYVDNEKDYSE